MGPGRGTKLCRTSECALALCMAVALANVNDSETSLRTRWPGSTVLDSSLSMTDAIMLPAPSRTSLIIHRSILGPPSPRTFNATVNSLTPSTQLLHTRMGSRWTAVDTHAQALTPLPGASSRVVLDRPLFVL
ncbi:hypothetical protein B0H15DRAFT_857072 [Mycena belliarum]|uniref:Secreted protein n=1 Tax=Mycena belliarum TaxID=1033014 RepID=A0AAD6TZ27_9AGAR|nr:hypothetical protein B0H15DRAFT_857072 [Mycena belliae]